MSLRILLLFLFLPFLASAHVPELPKYNTYDDITVVEQPEVSTAFYAELTGFPHRYEFVVDEASELSVSVLVPDLKETEDNIGGIIVKKRGDGLVDVIATLDVKDATWESFYEPFGGDSYRQGPEFTGEVGPGQYLIEISTAMNQGKYVLVVGQLEAFGDLGFFKTLKRIYEVKRFYGKPPIAVLQSPFYLVPFLILVFASFVIWYRRQNTHA